MDVQLHRALIESDQAGAGKEDRACIQYKDRCTECRLEEEGSDLYLELTAEWQRRRRFL